MKLKDVETLKVQAEALDVNIKIINYDVNRFSIVVNKHSYSNFNSALNAITTVWLKNRG